MQVVRMQVWFLHNDVLAPHWHRRGRRHDGLHARRHRKFSGRVFAETRQAGRV